ncbi:MAG: 4'-phosphopantetheinyl transferase superfamily protein [Candidatus Margulisbacteria bacterium]|nr:4'-phosphopantetheinyl transferase superfamily protein [Candidatus Margulisiibacteriota bacterium]
MDINPLKLQFLNKTKTIDASLCLAPSADFDIICANKTYFLSSNEQSVFNDLLHASRRQTYLLGRYCAKTAISSLKKIYFKETEIKNGIFGQPLLSASRHLDLEVSISHCGSTAGAFVFPTAYPMALDVEDINIEYTSIISSFLSEKENNLISGSKKHLDVYTTAIWTAKEALGKVLKCGFLAESNIFEIKSFEYNSVDQIFKGKFSFFPNWNFLVITAGQTMLTLVFPSALILNTNQCIIKDMLNSVMESNSK